MAKNILICDDAAFMRMMIKDILSKNGYDVAGEAENGAEGKFGLDIIHPHRSSGSEGTSRMGTFHRGEPGHDDP